MVVILARRDKNLLWSAVRNPPSPTDYQNTNSVSSEKPGIPVDKVLISRSHGDKQHKLKSKMLNTLQRIPLH